MEMFQASVEGEAFDIEKWGKYYVPYGLDRITTSKPSKEKAKEESSTVEKADKVESKTTMEEDVKTAEKKVAAASAKVEEKMEEDSNDSANKAQDILKMIRSRQK